MSIVLSFCVVAFAVLTARGVDRFMHDAAWTWRHPRIARRLWVSCAVSLAGCLLTLALLLAHDVWEHALLWLTDAAKPDLHAAYAGGRDVGTAWNWAAAIAVALLAAPACWWARQAWAAEGRRRVHRALDGRRQAWGGSTLLVTADADAPLYCVPGRRIFGVRRHVVVASESSWEQLSDEERGAAMAHELAHLRHRHHTTVALAEAFAGTAGRVGALPHLAAEVRRLVELEADDEAGRRFGRHVVASALLRLSVVARPSGTATGALQAGGGDTHRRVLRLLGPAVPASPVMRASTFCAAGALIALPPFLLAAPLTIVW